MFEHPDTGPYGEGELAPGPAGLTLLLQINGRRHKIPTNLQEGSEAVPEVE